MKKEEIKKWGCEDCGGYKCDKCIKKEKEAISFLNKISLYVVLFILLEVVITFLVINI